MDLDQHATRSARQLRSRVEAGLDISAARAAVATGSRRRAGRRQAGIGATAAALIAVVALITVTTGTDRDGHGPVSVRTNTGRPSTKGVPQSSAARGAALLRSVPASPVDGKVSYRLPVVADPQSGLRDGDTIDVYGKGFEPGITVGIVQCSSEADTANAGVAACQLNNPDYPPEKIGEIMADLQGWIDAGGNMSDTYAPVSYTTVSMSGTVQGTFEVSRYLETPAGGRIDCQSAPERCIIAVGDVSDLDHSGGAYLQFADAPQFATPTLAVDPPGPYAPGQTVTVRASALVPGRQVRLQQCQGDRCHTLVDGRPDASGTVAQPVVLSPTVVDSADGSTIACEDRCEVRVTLIGVAVATSAPVPDPLSITFAAPGDGPSPSPNTAPGAPGSFTPSPTTTTAATPPTAPGFQPAG